jgi:hypothetical protein
VTGPETITEDEPRKCRAVKRGGVDLHCTEDEGHDKGPAAAWHRATYREHREVSYDGSHHVVDMVETVTWEPVDEVAEVVRKLMKNRP